MWLINDDGFFSTVQDYNDSDWVYVRGRSESDIAAFVTVAQQATNDASWEAEIIHSPHRDYSWRIHTPRQIWADYLLTKASELSYGNFKNHCADRWMTEERDSAIERLELLHDTWMLLNHWPDQHL